MKASVKAARTRLSPTDRRAQLLQCSIAAFAEYGIARATHAHVAQRAGVSVAAVHSYFRTRKDLVIATLDAVESYLLRITASADAMKATAHETLTAMVTEFDREAQDNPDVIKVWLDWSTGFRADVWPRYLQMQERIYRVAQRALARGKRQGELSLQFNAKAAARLFVGGGHTVALTRFAGASTGEIEILIDHLVKSVTRIGEA